MDNERVEQLIKNVLSDMGLSADDYKIETAMGAPDGAVQIRMLEADGDGKAVVVNLKDENGFAVDDDEMRRRVESQIGTFQRASAG